MAIARVALIQMTAAPAPEENISKALRQVRAAADKGANIICLQELYRSLYFCRNYDQKHFDLAESIPGPSTEVFSAVAKEKSIVIILPLFEKRAEGVYHNTAVVIDADGEIRGSYRKMHIPDDPNFYEKYYFSPGDLGFKTFQTVHGKIGVLICWDQWFPEAARLACLGGAEILFYPTAIGWHDSETRDARKAQLTGWQTVQRGHAVANEVFVAAVNRVGREGDVTFWGHSFISDPFGTLIAESGETQEEILIADCDFEKITEIRRNWPFLRDRRIDSYQGLCRRYLDAGVST